MTDLKTIDLKRLRYDIDKEKDALTKAVEDEAIESLKITLSGNLQTLDSDVNSRIDKYLTIRNPN